MSQTTNQTLNAQNQSTPAESGATDVLSSAGTTTFSASKYQVENFTYPIDLFGTPSQTSGPGSVAFEQKLLNYVVFYINVSEASKVYKSQPGQFLGTIDRSEQNRITGGSLGAFSETATGAGAVVGAALGTIDGAGAFARGLASGGGIARRLGAATSGFAGSVATGAAAGAATNFIATELALRAQSELFTDTNFEKTQTFKRLKTAIALNVPQNMVVGYRVNYADEELGLLYGNAAAAGSESFNNAGGAIAAAAGAALIGRSPAAGAISALTKTALNPRKEQLFKSVDFRRFTFDYFFAPRNEAEANDVRNIINMFKYHMHPEYLNASNRLAFLYPSEFDIVYYYGTEEHKHLAKVSTCVLTEMTVNYAPNGQFSTHPDGSPTQINVQLTFLELETLTKERLGSENEGATGIRGRSTF
jgi:hypothetical protein